ncbi:hypothetical protein FLM48_10170 [Shewanella sp. Scap07]|uniref:hypothetical protein n=1 Tax=Shewanella sp. Scap07 TaxID=2589987 RepID=UPI0015BACEE2|nr:hypothetical protein [Shewanella sp. Scap07]QLE85411.1 hypothetical protein FLM48_10170 [Shewanella sp. Scap07]
MIKFSYSYPDGFEDDFRSDFIVDICQVKAREELDNCTAEERVEAETLLSDESIHNLAFCNATELKQEINRIFTGHPVIVDYYNPVMFFSKYNFRFDLLKLDLSRQNIENRDRVTNYKDELLETLFRIKDEKSSLLAQYLHDELKELNTPVEIRDLLRAVQSLHQGKSKPFKDEAPYPSWVKNLSNIFDYEKCRSEYGLQIVKSSNLEVCPFCNNNPIIIAEGKRHIDKPDLDHFYPKSIYPFLAITLSNFVPSCHRCNRTFKRDEDTYVEIIEPELITDTYSDYMHPLVEGTLKSTVFHFLPATDRLTSPTVLVSGFDGFMKNIDLFELKSVYEVDKFVREYKSLKYIFDQKKGLEGSAQDAIDDEEFMAMALKLGQAFNEKNVPNFKFNLDAIESISNLKVNL